MLKTGMTQRYCDPLSQGIHEAQEIARTYYQVSLRRVRVYHSIRTHFLPLYFPEAEKYWHRSRSEWFCAFLLRFPNPASILRYTQEEFMRVAWEVAERKTNKTAWLADFYQTAARSIGLPVPEDSEGIRMFRLILQEYLGLRRLRAEIEKHADRFLGEQADYRRLRTIPGIGPIGALTILAEAGDLRRFSHYKKFLKYCGLDLCTHQSGGFRGVTQLSKYGNSRLRLAFWMAATVAIRTRENTFRYKYERYIQADPRNKDLKRKAYVAVAAKVARVAYSLIKSSTDYRCFYESAIPSGRIPSPQAVEAPLTS